MKNALVAYCIPNRIQYRPVTNRASWGRDHGTRDPKPRSMEEAKENMRVEFRIVKVKRGKHWPLPTSVFKVLYHGNTFQVSSLFPFDALEELPSSKRGVCPACRGKFRIPKTTQEYSTDITNSSASDAEFLSLLEPNLLKRRKTVKADSPSYDSQAFTYLSPNQMSDSLDSDVATSEERPLAKQTESKNRSSTTSKGNSSKVVPSIDSKSTRNDPNHSRPKKSTSPNGSGKNNIQTKQEIAPLPTPRQTKPAERAYFVSPPSGGQYGPANH